MGIAKSYSSQLVGLKCEIVIVEVDISNGLNNFSLVGLGDRSVTEAKDRISAAIKNTGYQSPKQKNQKVVISLAPADARKEGSAFDLAMAIAYLFAAGEISFDPHKTIFLGELSLEGSVNHVTGLLPMLCQLSLQGFHTVFIPAIDQEEASLARGINIYPVSCLKEVLDILSGLIKPDKLRPYSDNSIRMHGDMNSHIDMSVIRGNEVGKRGLEIAAAGAHNIILSGPPGTGKTMLAKSFCSILPLLSYEHSIEVTGIHSAAKMLGKGLISSPPFRSPHHTASYPSIVGGGSFPRPGEITLAHRGVLFMDEFPEFDRSVIEALRQPLEDRIITISRAKGVITFPAQCILIASMNPCPCGKGRDRGCTCTERSILNYKKKVSSPIMDRIDLFINIDRVDYDTLAIPVLCAENSETISRRVSKARMIAKARFSNFGSSKNYNSEMDAKDIEKLIKINDKARNLLLLSAKKFEFSARVFHRIIKVAQTISDLDDKSTIEESHILEALQYREKKESGPY